MSVALSFRLYTLEHTFVFKLPAVLIFRHVKTLWRRCDSYVTACFCCSLLSMSKHSGTAPIPTNVFTFVRGQRFGVRREGAAGLRGAVETAGVGC